MAYTKTTWNVATLFVIMLVVSLPVYSANGLAALQITKNHGEAGIEGFINGNQDVWTVEAKVSGVAEEMLPVSTDEVTIQVENLPEQQFQQCEDREGEAFCTIVTPREGLNPRTQQFTVRYNNLVDDEQEASSFIHADTGAPTVTINSVQQVGTEVVVNLEVDDPEQDGRCVGLRDVQIIDSDSFQALDQIVEFPNNKCQLRYNQPLPISFDGEGRRHIKVQAVDLLGHETISNIEAFDTDFVGPVIDVATLKMSESNGFIGRADLTTDITVNVTETTAAFIDCNQNVDCGVTASSEQASFRANGKATCAVAGGDIWTCTWNGVIIAAASETVVLNIAATDVDGNTGSASKTIRLVKDDTPPRVVFFGTERTYLDESYVSKNDNIVIARITDEGGSGITKDGVVADLSKISAGLTDEHPADCVADGGEFLCTWDPVSGAGLTTGQISIKLSELVDVAGNINGGSNVIDVQVDVDAPLIEKVGLFAISPVTGKKNFFQSKDEVQLELEVKESAGLLIKVDTTDFINDLGVVEFTEDLCVELDSGNWDCELLLPKPLKGSLGETALLKIEVFDTAGNAEKARSWPAGENLKKTGDGQYTFKLLASDDQTNPDFWRNEEQEGEALLEFVDLDTAQLAPTRMPIEMTFESTDRRVKMVQAVAPQGACVPVAEGGPPVRGVLLYNGVDPAGETNPTVQFFVEFEPFDASVLDLEDEGGKVIEVDYTCGFQLFSKTGQSVTRNAELQEFTVSIPFGYSELGALDENLKGKLDGIRDEWKFEIAEKLSVLHSTVSYARYFAGVVQWLISFDKIINIAKAKQEGLRAVPLSGAAIAAGLCKVEDGVQTQVVGKTLEVLQVPLTLITCDPKPSSLGWYTDYQGAVLNTYNQASGRALLGLHATSLYENIWISMFGLCLPGIVHNMEKYRQVKCREMLCYKNEVPAGLATVDSCKKMGEYLECRFWDGGQHPQYWWVDTWQMVVAFIESWAAWPSNVVGLIKLGIQTPCAYSCIESNTVSAACRWTGTIVVAIDWLDTIVSTIQNWPAETNDIYCSQLEDD